MKVSNPRGRPRQFNREAALKAALALFLERGFDATSVADLVTAMGIAPPSLYAAFGSKEGLYREVLQLYLEGRGGFVSKALASPAPVEEQLRQMLVGAAEAFTPENGEVPGCMVSTEMVACSPSNLETAEHVRSLRAMPQAAFARRLEQARKDGEICTYAAPEALARFYSAVVTGMAIQARDGASRQELLEIATSAMLVLQPSSHPTPRKKGGA